MFSNASFECLLKLHTSSFALEIKLKIFIAEVVQSVHKWKILSIGYGGSPFIAANHFFQRILSFERTQCHCFTCSILYLKLEFPQFIALQLTIFCKSPIPILHFTYVHTYVLVLESWLQNEDRSFKIQKFFGQKKSF